MPWGLEEQLGQALEELVERQLVDVLLEREVDVAPGVTDLRDALDRAHVLSRHPRAQPRLDARILEVKEVPRVVPDEPGRFDGLAVAADLGVRLADQDALAGRHLAPPVREAEATDAGPEHQDVGINQAARARW